MATACLNVFTNTPNCLVSKEREEDICRPCWERFRLDELNVIGDPLLRLAELWRRQAAALRLAGEELEVAAHGTALKQQADAVEQQIETPSPPATCA